MISACHIVQTRKKAAFSGQTVVRTFTDLTDRGQILVFLLIVLPVLMVLCGVIVRSGRTLLAHQQIENHCNKKILDALAAQAKGLVELGNLNNSARATIEQRRALEETSKMDPVPSAKMATAAEIALLEAKQAATAAKQKSIIAGAAARSALILNSTYSLASQKKILEKYTPSNPILPHALKNSLTLHVKPEPGYEKEIGPPLVLDVDFDRRQREAGNILVQTESFLAPWAGFKKSEQMTVSCEGKIEMNSLEDKKWKAQLVPVTARPLSRRLFQLSSSY